MEIIRTKARKWYLKSKDQSLPLGAPALSGLTEGLGWTCGCDSRVISLGSWCGALQEESLQARWNWSVSLSVCVNLLCSSQRFWRGFGFTFCFPFGAYVTPRVAFPGKTQNVLGQPCHGSVFLLLRMPWYIRSGILFSYLFISISEKRGWEGAGIV